MISRRRFLQGAAATSVAGACSSPSRPPTREPPIPPYAETRSDSIRYDPEGPLLFLAAHCDDGPVEAWHLLSTAKAVKHVIAFMGVPPEGTVGHDDKRGDYDAVAYMHERQAEERAALAPLHIEPYFLSGLDMPYRNGKVPSLGALARELMALVPVASRIACPLGLGIRYRVGTPTYSHVDHKLARDLAEVFPHIPKVYFGEVYAVSEKTADYNELYAEMQTYPGWRIEKITLTPDELAAKRAAFDKYKTQIQPMLSAIPELLEPQILGTEIYCYPGG